MGIIVRQSVKSTILSNIGFAIGTLNVLFLATALLSADEIGLFRVIVELSVLFGIIAQLGMPQVIDRFFPVFHENKQDARLLTFILVYPLAGLLVFYGIIFLFGDLLIQQYEERSPLLADKFSYIVPLTTFFVYNLILEAYARAHLRIVVPVFIRDVYLRLTNTAAILLFGLGVVSLEFFLWLLVGATFSATALLFIYMLNLGILRPLKDFNLRHFTAMWAENKMSSMMGYGLFIILGGLGVMLSNKIDMLMIPAYIDLRSTGIYIVAVYMGVVVELPKKSLTLISIPILVRAIHASKWDEVKMLYQKTGLNQLIIGLFIFIGIWTNLDSIFTLIPNSDTYDTGRLVIILIGLSKLIDMSCGLSSEIISYSKYYRFTMIGMLLLAIFTISTNILLIPAFGINGAAAATATSIFLYTVIKLVYNQYRFGIHPFTKSHIYPIIIGAVAFGITFLLPQFSESLTEAILSILYRSLVLAIIYGLGIYYSKISVEINNLIEMGLTRIRIITGI